MASVDFVAVPNNSAHLTFDDLRLGRSPQEVLCRLLRFWDSRNMKRDHEFMGITMLFLDEKNTVIHGFIPAAIADEFRQLLREGLIYKITSFDVGRCTKFMLRKVDQLQALANTNLELPGNLILNSTPGTRFYLDSSIEAIKKFSDRFGISGDAANFIKADTTETLAKMETISIRDLQRYISQPAEPTQDADFLCNATVIGVLKRSGWSYVACGACSRKLDRNRTSLRCNQCVSSRITGIVRYRVELAVKDISETATFVVFDSKMTKLTSKMAATLTAEMNDEHRFDIPPCLEALANNTYIFHMRIHPFNFTSGHRNFTVSKMTLTPNPEIEEEEQVLPHPHVIADEDERAANEIPERTHQVVDNQTYMWSIQTLEVATPLAFQQKREP